MNNGIITNHAIVNDINIINFDIVKSYEEMIKSGAISIYAPSYIAREVIKYLVINIDELWVHNHSVNKILFQDCKDVVITLYDDGMIFVEEARFDGLIKDNSDSDFTYIHDSFKKHEVDELNKNGQVLIFGFDD